MEGKRKGKGAREGIGAKGRRERERGCEDKVRGERGEEREGGREADSVFMIRFCAWSSSVSDKAVAALWDFGAVSRLGPTANEVQLGTRTPDKKASADPSVSLYLPCWFDGLSTLQLLLNMTSV